MLNLDYLKNELVEIVYTSSKLTLKNDNLQMAFHCSKYFNIKATKIDGTLIDFDVISGKTYKILDVNFCDELQGIAEICYTDFYSSLELEVVDFCDNVYGIELESDFISVGKCFTKNGKIVKQIFNKRLIEYEGGYSKYQKYSFDKETLAVLDRLKEHHIRYAFIDELWEKSIYEVYNEYLKNKNKEPFIIPNNLIDRLDRLRDNFIYAYKKDEMDKNYLIALFISDLIKVKEELGYFILGKILNRNIDIDALNNKVKSNILDVLDMIEFSTKSDV